jgi:hypothetical protein
MIPSTLPTTLPVSPYGTFTGTLFQYLTFPSLTAFESKPEKPNKCILIGGLSDSLIPTPYTNELQKSCNELDNWSLVQPTMSSSGLGFGHGSLKRDTEEISILIKYLTIHHNAEKIVLVGHSTGCQNAIHLTKYGESDIIEYIKGIVLQAPCSDREGAMVDNPTQYECNINHAKQLQKEGKEEELMPRDAFWAPITAYRFLSLQDVGGDDDFFSSDFSDEELEVRLKHVGQCGEFFGLKALVAFSKEDEYVPAHIDKDLLLERLCKAMNTECKSSEEGGDGTSNLVATPLMLENSNHNLSSDDEDRAKFVEAVKGMLSEIN